MDVCGDREDPIPGIDGAMVANAVTPGTAHVTYQPVWDEAAPTVARIARPGDLVITVGCGDVTKVAPKIVDGDSAPCWGAMTATATVRRRSRPKGAPKKSATRRQKKQRRSLRRTALAVIVIAVVLALLAGSLWVVYLLKCLGHQAGQCDRHSRPEARPSQLYGASARRGAAGSSGPGRDFRTVTTMPAIEAATVTRSWPNTITVSVIERQPVSRCLAAGRLSRGRQARSRLSDAADAAAEGRARRVNPGDEPLLGEIAIVATAMPEKLSRKVELITASSRDSIMLLLGSGRTVAWGSSTDSELKAQVVMALLKRKPQSSIDVSSPHNPATR